MSMENLTDDQLLNLLDSIQSEAEMQLLKNKFRGFPAVIKRLEELYLIHIFLQRQNQVEQPSKNFTASVMTGLHARPAFMLLSPKNGLLLLVGLMVASGLAVALVSSGALDQWHTYFSLGRIPIKNNLIKLPATVPFDLKTTVKIFVMINVVIGFVLLDRTILRPIFQKRAQRFN
jgi:hypothetical protein